MISVIICTYNRCESLKAALDSLLSQTYRNDLEYEIIVVDNNSKDETKEVVSDYAKQIGKKMRYVFEPQQGISHARNKGAREAWGDIIAFVDDDVVVDKNWLNEIKRIFSSYPCDAVGGRVIPRYPDGAPEWVKDNKDILTGPIVCHDYGDDIVPYDKNKMLPLVGANMAFRKACFDRCGLFNTSVGVGQNTMGEDTDFFLRLMDKKMNIYYCGTVMVWHVVVKGRMAIRYIVSWNIKAGRYLARNHRPDGKLIYYLGVPRYLFKEILSDMASLVTNIFDRRGFLKYLQRASLNIGQSIEYRSIKNA